jgi:methionyl-tRNA formyltransferase
MTRKIYILANDENIFHPSLFRAILSKKPDSYTVIGAAMVKRRKRENTRGSLEHLYQLGGLPAIARVAGIIAQRTLQRRFIENSPTTVRSLFKAYGVPMREIDSPNQADFVEWLDQQQPDILFCTVSNILKKPILSAPRIACVNRHTGKLPEYRGSEPVFHALRLREPTITVTYHTMAEEIDGGNILWEHTEPVSDRDTVYTMYDRMYKASECGFWPAIEALEKQTSKPIDLSYGATYTRPTPEEIAEFRKLGRRYV